MLLIMMEIIKVVRLESWFAERMQGLRCSPETVAYVAGVLKAQSHPGDADDLSKQSVILAYHDAIIKGDFASFQRIGDWVLWIEAICPEFISENHQIIETIGRQAYYSCHRLLRGQWHLYEELADELPSIAAKVRHTLV